MWVCFLAFFYLRPSSLANRPFSIGPYLQAGFDEYPLPDPTRTFFLSQKHVKKRKSKMPKKQQKMASNQKMQENKPTLKFNFT